MKKKILAQIIVVLAAATLTVAAAPSLPGYRDYEGETEYISIVPIGDLGGMPVKRSICIVNELP